MLPFTFYVLLLQKEATGALTHTGAHLDLSAFSSWEELASLGLDRLKSALMALGLKCGGWGLLIELSADLRICQSLFTEEIFYTTMYYINYNRITCVRLKKKISSDTDGTVKRNSSKLKACEISLIWMYIC